MNNYPFLGVVRAGRFHLLASDHPTGATFRLTGILRQAAQPADSGEIPLIQYEGSVILVRGIEDGEWIYGAVVVERAGQILTIVAQMLFGESEVPKVLNIDFV